MIVGRQGREAKLFGGLGVLHETPEGRRPLREAYQGKMYTVIHKIPLSREISLAMNIAEASPGRNV